MAFKLAGRAVALRQVWWLLLFSTLLVATTIAVHRDGVSALDLTLGLATLVAISRVFASYGRSARRLTQVLRALANLDASMRFPQDAPLQREFDRVRERILRSQAELRSQARFLRTMLTHLDVSIIVVDDTGRIVHKNPAVDRLLGTLPNDVSDPAWGALGELLHRAREPVRTILPWRRGEHEDTLSIHISFSRNEARRTTIVNVQSIRLALEAKEQLAYKRLTRVLTHEVANSVMPLASLANTATTLLPKGLRFADQEIRNDLEEALRTLATRAVHLNQFIDRFAEMSRLPPPSLKRVDLRGLIGSVLALFEDTFSTHQIKANLQAKPDRPYWVMADLVQIEQALVNLVINAVESLKTSEERRLTASIALNEQDQLIVDIRDSGPGIEPHVREHIFVPFFTTKPKGSGIGLSLARQIMVGHGGDLQCIDTQSAGGEPQGAHFRLVFS